MTWALAVGCRRWVCIVVKAVRVWVRAGRLRGRLKVVRALGSAWLWVPCFLKMENIMKITGKLCLTVALCGLLSVMVSAPPVWADEAPAAKVAHFHFNGPLVEKPQPDFGFSFGMEPDTLSRVFDPFFTTRRDLDGCGLGMHIVHNLVSQSMGGTIECASAPGAGVTVRMVIPLAKA